MRVLISRGGWKAGDRVNLAESEVHHLRVRRAREGESVEILDGGGLRGSGRLVRAGKEWTVEVERIQREEHPPQTMLAVATGDRTRFSWMVEKSVELGVTSIVPLETARCTGVATRLKDAHVGRLRQLALESTKQCGVAWAPSVEDAVALTDFLGRPAPGVAWVADQGGDPPPAELKQESVSVVIGPEGGLTGDELDALGAAGYHSVALAPHTLRFETAALAAAAAVTQARLRGRHG